MKNPVEKSNHTLNLAEEYQDLKTRFMNYYIQIIIWEK
jgi:hypothetical protein